MTVWRTERSNRAGNLGQTAYRTLLVPIGMVLLLACVGLLRAGYGEEPAMAKLHTLISARAVHELSMEEARRAYPIRLRATVLYYDPFLDAPVPILLIADRTGTVFVHLPQVSTLPLKAGQLVMVTGESMAGGFAPDVNHGRVRILADSSAPGQAPLRSLTYLLSGREDAPWVEMEGVVHSVKASEHNVILKIAGADGVFTAATMRQAGVDYAALVDERVRIRGVACSLFNKKKQIVGIQMRFADLAAMQVEESSLAKWFQLPLSRVRELGSFRPGQRADHLVHVRGIVTLSWPGRMLCLEDGQDGLCVGTDQTNLLRPGDVVDAVGFPEVRSYTPMLVDTRFQGVAGRTQPGSLKLEADKALNGEHDAQLVEIDGQVIGLDRAGKDPTVLLAVGDLIFAASLPSSSGGEALFGLAEGSQLRVRGICQIEADAAGLNDADGYKLAKTFLILMRSPGDITMLRRPSWWSARHTMEVLACTLVAISCAFAWVLVLRRRLEIQTEQLQFQATHDGLTGLWNRRAILELLRREFEIATRSRSSIGILMIDADHFKRVNDTYGHLVGDVVLQAIGEGIRQAIRSSELAARCGGEEFLIVLPGSDRDQAKLVAERVRLAIAQRPVRCDAIEVSMTVSVGVSLLAPDAASEEQAIASADEALYEAKRLGRNRVVVSGAARSRVATDGFGGEAAHAGLEVAE